MNETTSSLLEAAEPVLRDVREKLFNAADCERGKTDRLRSLSKAATDLSILIKEIQHVIAEEL